MAKIFWIDKFGRERASEKVDSEAEDFKNYLESIYGKQINCRIFY